ncbi:MAG: hypothetical protein PHE19_02875 [Candidatus Cloacimonetes bacterium]|nr:hypothetical protein [Candidatus Cloacimonadota bacterium]
MKNTYIKYIIFFLLLLSPIYLISDNHRKFDTDFLIHIRIYDEKDNKISRELKNIFSEQMDKFQRKLKHYPDIHVYIRISPNDKHYQQLIKDRSQVLEFSRGFTDLRTKEIFLKNPRSIRSLKTYSNLIMHEYIHLFIDWHWSDAPLWFHEGMAVYFSEGISFERYVDFMQFYAYKPTNLIKENPYTYPNNPHFYSAYYFQSAQAVKKLYQDNQKRFYELWDYKQIPFETAFYTIYQQSSQSFLKQFDQDIKKNFHSGIIFMVISAIWASLPILVVIGNIRKRRINKRIIEEWEKDQLEDQAFEYVLENNEEIE